MSCAYRRDQRDNIDILEYWPCSRDLSDDVRLSTMLYNSSRSWPKLVEAPYQSSLYGVHFTTYTSVQTVPPPSPAKLGKTPTRSGTLASSLGPLWAKPRAFRWPRTWKKSVYTADLQKRAAKLDPLQNSNGLFCQKEYILCWEDEDTLTTKTRPSRGQFDYLCMAMIIVCCKWEDSSLAISGYSSSNIRILYWQHIRMHLWQHKG